MPEASPLTHWTLHLLAADPRETICKSTRKGSVPAYYYIIEIEAAAQWLGQALASEQLWVPAAPLAVRSQGGDITVLCLVCLICKGGSGRVICGPALFSLESTQYRKRLPDSLLL